LQRTTAVLGSALFFVAAPCVAAGLVPWWLSALGAVAAVPGCLELTRAVGAALIVAGIPGS
jgi:hypothetical protein